MPQAVSERNVFPLDESVRDDELLWRILDVFDRRAGSLYWGEIFPPLIAPFPRTSAVVGAPGMRPCPPRQRPHTPIGTLRLDTKGMEEEDVRH